MESYICGKSTHAHTRPQPKETVNFAGKNPKSNDHSELKSLNWPDCSLSRIVEHVCTTSTFQNPTSSQQKALKDCQLFFSAHECSAWHTDTHSTGPGVLKRGICSLQQWWTSWNLVLFARWNCYPSALIQRTPAFCCICCHPIKCKVV